MSMILKQTVLVLLLLGLQFQVDGRQLKDNLKRQRELAANYGDFRYITSIGTHNSFNTAKRYKFLFLSHNHFDILQ
jgi:hypothetical protein